MPSDIAVSARLQASGRLAHSRASRRPASQLQLADPQQILQVMLLAKPRMIMQEAPNALSTYGTWGTARQKPGRVVLRHFCNWLLCCNEGSLIHGLSVSGARCNERRRGCDD